MSVLIKLVHPLLVSLVVACQLTVRVALATPPDTYLAGEYNGYVFPGLFDRYVPAPEPDSAGFRVYSFPDAPNSLSYWQDCDVKKMLPADRALGLNNPQVVFFGTHGRLKPNQQEPLKLLNSSGCKFGFATTCNEISRGPLHTATEMARQTRKICFGINPKVDASMIVTLDGGTPRITIQEILPNGTDGALLGSGTKQFATIVAVTPDGRVIPVPHPERIPQLAGAVFDFPETNSACNSEGGTLRRSSAPPSSVNIPLPSRYSYPSSFIPRMQQSFASLGNSISRAGAFNARYSGAPEMALTLVPHAVNDLTASAFPNAYDSRKPQSCRENPFESDVPGLFTYLTGRGETASNVVGNLVYITTGYVTHDPNTSKQWWDPTSSDGFDLLPGTWWNDKPSPDR